MEFCAWKHRIDLSPHGGAFDTNENRLKNRAALLEIVNAATGVHPKGDLIQLLTKFGVPVGPINTMEEAFQDDQLVDREMRIYPEGVPGLRTPIIFSDSILKNEQTAPTLGEEIQETTSWK